MKVKSVKLVKLEEPIWVYDLTVEGTENFCLANGVVTHNSKDVADAVAGAVYSASQSRVIRSQSTVSGNLRERVRSKSVKRRSFRVKKTSSVDNENE